MRRVLLHSIDLLDTVSKPTTCGSAPASVADQVEVTRIPPTMLRLPASSVAGDRVFLGKLGVTLRQIYDHPHDHHAAFQLCEGLVDYDQLLQTWRQRHLTLVYRIIGTGTPSLKGKHSDLLVHGLKQRFFPKLWDVRDEVFADWTDAQAAKGKETGYHG